MNLQDLLSMARSSHALRDFFMSKTSKLIWKASWASSELPELPSDRCEPLYASLIFDRQCFVRLFYNFEKALLHSLLSQYCDAKGVLKIDFATMHRCCVKCIDTLWARSSFCITEAKLQATVCSFDLPSEFEKTDNIRCDELFRSLPCFGRSFSFRTPCVLLTNFVDECRKEWAVVLWYVSPAIPRVSHFGHIWPLRDAGKGGTGCLPWRKKRRNGRAN